MVICMLILTICSMRKVREDNFNIFFHVHHLYIIIIVLLMVHGLGNVLQPAQNYVWVCICVFCL